jgi:dihydrofolate synthase/folylpolyglutamate synthase
VASDREYLFSLELVGIKLGLDQIRALLNQLDHPELAYRSIVIAGTNGKGSVTAMVERALRAARYRTGRYTSPHLTDIEERFAIDGAPISPAEFDRLADRVRSAAQALPSPPSFFEATTALALEAFREAGVDVAVLEVGLGGRLDATNAVGSVACAITAIDFDHEKYLGDTLPEIAREKAGIIRPDGLVVLGENIVEVRNVIEGVAAAQGATLVYAPQGVTAAAALEAGITRLDLRTPVRRYPAVRLGLRGRHQVPNAVVAVRLLEEVALRGIVEVPQAAIRTGLEDVQWPGRLEARAWQGIDLLIDGAHNPAGARALAAYLREAFDRPLPIVIGAMRDKHIDRMLEALAPVSAAFVATAIDSPRAASPQDIADRAAIAAPGIPVGLEARPMDAIVRAAQYGNPVIVAGSLYLAGEIRAKLT